MERRGRRVVEGCCFRWQFCGFNDGGQLSENKMLTADVNVALSSTPVRTWAECVKWCIVNDWQWDSAVAGAFLPSEQLMVQRAYPSGGDKHCGPTMMPDVLSTVLSAATKHSRLGARRVFTFRMSNTAVNVSTAYTEHHKTVIYFHIQHLRLIFLKTRETL